MKRKGVNTPPSDRWLQRVAELRAEGWSWSQVAKQLQAKERTISKWPWRYAERWQRLYQQAEDLAADHVAAESRLVLTQKFRTAETEKAQIDAAGKLLTYIQRRQTKRRVPGSASPAAIKLAEYLQGLTDEDLHRAATAVDSAADASAGEGGTIHPEGAD
jgi:hypothetical protein